MQMHVPYIVWERIDNTIEVDKPLLHSNKVNFSDNMNII